LLLTIEKLIYGGDGLARLPAATPANAPIDAAIEDSRARGKAVFIPFTLEGEKVEAAIAETKPGFARAKVESVVEPSPHRIAPSCQYFARCGGCHYQHTTYEHQLEIKTEILRENLRRFAKIELPGEIEIHPSPPWNYRNRSRLQVRSHPAFAAGYFKLNSHEVQPVEECPISSPLINRAIAALWQLGRAGKVPEGIREIEFFANAEDAQLLVELSCASGARRAAIKTFAEEFRASLSCIIGITAFRDVQPSKKTSKRGRQAPIISQETLLSSGESHLTYQTSRGNYRVSQGAFFQINRHLIDELVKIVTAGRSGELALDLYSGVGLFSTALACDFRHIVSVESSQTAAADLSYNLPSNGEAIRAATEQYLNRPEPGGSTRQQGQPDLVVVDPPRGGLGDRVAGALASLGAPRITYVSCDPATLARDLVILAGAGYRVEQAHLVDLFPQTYHLESILHLVK
jgi:23S rRNA (uracil1939-C5)-methyltransferase